MSIAENTMQQASVAVAATTGSIYWITAAADVALAIFGVPLPVVLAAATGAAGARTFVPHVSYKRAVFEGLLWGVVGIFTAQLALWGFSTLFGSTIPTGALSGAALLVAAGGQIFVTPEFIENARAALRRRMAGIGRAK